MQNMKQMLQPKTVQCHLLLLLPLCGLGHIMCDRVEYHCLDASRRAVGTASEFLPLRRVPVPLLLDTLALSSEAERQLSRQGLYTGDHF